MYCRSCNALFHNSPSLQLQELLFCMWELGSSGRALSSGMNDRISNKTLRTKVALSRSNTVKSRQSAPTSSTLQVKIPPERPVSPIRPSLTSCIQYEYSPYENCSCISYTDQRSTARSSTDPSKLRVCAIPGQEGFFPGQEGGQYCVHFQRGWARVCRLSAVQYGITESHEDTINHFPDKKSGKGGWERRGALAGFYGNSVRKFCFFTAERSKRVQKTYFSLTIFFVCLLWFCATPLNLPLWSLFFLVVVEVIVSLISLVDHYPMYWTVC